MGVQFIALALFLLVSPTRAGTPASIIVGCQFQACELATSRCCSLARQQKTACDRTYGVNNYVHPQHGQAGKQAARATNECSRCSAVYIERFC